MKTSEAVKYVLSKYSLSKYRMAQDLGCAPTLVNYWLKSTRMGGQYRALFNKLYGVEIDDTLETSNKTS